MFGSQSDLVARREEVMDKADRALDAAWPNQNTPEYVRAMQFAAAGANAGKV